MIKNNLELFKEFLDSGTKGANLTKIVLCIITISSLPFIVIGAGAMGNAVQVFRMFDKNEKYKDRQITNAINGLHRRKSIEYISDKNGITKVFITDRGKRELKSFAINLIKVSKPKKWDQKWRLVMFDLPIRYSKIRNALRFKLKQIGFVQFQKSVWIYPYPCLEEILFVADYYKIGKFVEVMTIFEINGDSKFRKLFDLK